MAGQTPGPLAMMTLNSTMQMSTTDATDHDGFVFEDHTQRVVVSIITILISFFGLTGNVLVLFAVSLSRKLQTKVNVFVVNLSIADSIISCVLPFSVVALLSNNGWPLPSFLCAAAAGILWIALGAGTVTLALIAFNRYYVIKQYNFDKAYTSKRIAIMIGFAWLYPAILTILATQLGLGRLGYSHKYKSCLQDSTHPLSEYLSLFAGIVVFIPSLIVIIFCYVMIFLHVRKHNRHLLRIFITGGSGGGSESYRDSDFENSTSLRSPTQHVHFNHTAITADSQAAQRMSAPPEIDVHHPPPSVHSASPARPTSLMLQNPVCHGPGTTVGVENSGGGRGIGARTKSVSEELSSSVSRRQADITRNVFYVVCAFLGCLTPYGVAILLPDTDPGIPWLMLILQFNTCVNPVIYALKHPTFREVIPRIIRCDFANIPSQSPWLKKLRGT